MKKAIIYVRVSTDKQETERQKAELRAYANYLGYEVIDVLEDIESGLHDDRPQFMKLLTYTKNELDAVLVWEISRIGRKTSTVIKTIEDWTAQGICFIAKKENLISLDADGKMNANTKLFLSIMATIAENEANTIKERMKSGKIYKLRNGGEYADKTPFGYIKVNGKFQINEEEAKLVKAAYEMRAEGQPYSKISKYMGLPKDHMIGILQNECYKGIAHNAYVPDMEFTTPKIVDEELWDKVQKTFKKRATQNEIAKFAPLRMKIVCPICGCKLSYGIELNNCTEDEIGHRYCCPNRKVIHPPYSRIVNAEKLHEAIENAIDSIPCTEIKVEEPEMLQRYIDALEADKAKYEREATILQKKLDAVREFLTTNEIESEQKKIVKMMERADNVQVEIDVAKAKLSNAIILKSAPFLFSQDKKWHDLVKEVRLVEFKQCYKKFEVELIDGTIKYVEVNMPRGCAGRKSKEELSEIARKREAKKRAKRMEQDNNNTE